jgi:1-acyl-sn-glycerol-3-phosphate acyltransferase
MMRMVGDIPVKRGSHKSRAQSLAQISDRLDKKVSVIILPEGTRSRTGELLPFHDGAFRIAVEKQLPILPIAVAGTGDCMPAGSLLFGKATAEARVLAPVETAGLGVRDVEELKQRVRGMIATARAELQRELA